jgi:tRNA G18 (ribose-2'-O)-methylase SpoU
MKLNRITDADDPLVDDYRDLTDTTLRRRKEPEEGLFMAESHQVIRRALQAGYPVRSVLTTSRWVTALENLPIPAEAPVFVAEDDVVRQITGYRVHRGALAAMARRPLPTVATVTGSARRVLVLEGIVDHTNVGAVFRSAAGLGIDAVLVDPTCADPLYRRAVRVSMGAVFALPWTRVTPWPQALEDLVGDGWELLALTPRADALALGDLSVDPEARVGLVLGSEGAGLTDAALRQVTKHVRIPMAAGIDSLNVAAAVAIACYVIGQVPAHPGHDK